MARLFLTVWVCLVGVAVVATGCGVQSGDDSDAAACAEVEVFFAIKNKADALDQEMLNLRPTKVTPDTVRALAPRYSDASEQYGDFFARAEEELARARSDDSDFTDVWELETESLAIRRDAFTFAADVFANPESFKDPAVSAESDEWLRKTEDINTRVEESSNRWLRDHDFEETADGNFIIDC